MLTENNNHLVPVLFKPLSFLKLAVHFFEMFLLLFNFFKLKFYVNNLWLQVTIILQLAVH